MGFFTQIFNMLIRKTNPAFNKEIKGYLKLKM